MFDKSNLNKLACKKQQYRAPKYAILNLVVASVILSGCGGSSDSSDSTDQSTPDSSLPINTCETSSGLTQISTSSALSFNVEQAYSAGQF